jgi:hypothetical protein
VKTKQSEPEIEIEKNMEDMQEVRTVLAMSVTAHKNMLNQLADRDREIVKLCDPLEGWKSVQARWKDKWSGCTWQPRSVTRTDS